MCEKRLKRSKVGIKVPEIVRPNVEAFEISEL
ncbi:hypothetical protein ES705_28482 [subsurface metagenome]